jgi:hypothetical protein
MSLVRTIVLVLMAVFIVSCKIKIVVPEGGSVDSASGAYNCSSGKICKIDVADIFFSEIFTALPAEGYVFHEWKKRSNALCSRTSAPCNLSTAGFDEFPALMAVLESNAVFQLQPIFVKPSKPLRIFQDGDAILYRGDFFSEDADGVETTSEITAEQQYLNTDSEINGLKLSVQRFLVRLTIPNGDEIALDPLDTFYDQKENGELTEYTDENLFVGEGDAILDFQEVKFGVLSIPSPMVPLSKQVFKIRSFAAEDFTTSVWAGSLVIEVSRLKNVKVPMGTFKAYKVISKRKMELLVTEEAGATKVVDQVLWVVPNIGVVKTKTSQRSYDNRGVFDGVNGTSLEALEANY